MDGGMDALSTQPEWMAEVVVVCFGCTNREGILNIMTNQYLLRMRQQTGGKTTLPRTALVVLVVI